MPVADYPDIYVSTAYIFITFAVAEIIRNPCRQLGNELFQKCALEFVSAFELCAVCYELTIILDGYGYFAYSVYLFLATLWWEYRWDVSACPYTHVENWLAGTTDAFSGIVLIAAEVIGGLCFYRFYLQYLWSLEYGSAHKIRVRQQQCTSDIQVAFWLAALVEGSGVCFCRLISRWIETQVDSRVGGTINAFIGTSLVIAALSYSGGYFNSALASSLQYGCKGSGLLEHLTVYWLAPTAGAILAYLIWQSETVRDLFVTSRPKED